MKEQSRKGRKKESQTDFLYQLLIIKLVQL